MNRTGVETYLRYARSLDPEKVGALLDFQAKFGAEGVAKELLRDYLEECPRRLAAILPLFRESRIGELGDAMHGLKASAGNVGGMKLFRICDRIEALAGALSSGQTLAEIRRIETEFQREFLSLETEIREFCELL